MRTFMRCLGAVLAIGCALPAAAQSARTLDSFNGPRALALDAHGNAFVADLTTDAVYEVAAAGGYPASKPLGRVLGQLGSFVIDSQNNVFIINSQEKTVKEILASGGYQQVKTLAGITVPCGIAKDSHDNLFITDCGANAIVELLAAGDYTTVNTLVSGMDYPPDAIALDPHSSIFVTLGGANGVREYTAENGYQTAYTIGSSFSQPNGLAIDAHSNLFVADGADGAIKELPIDGFYAQIVTLEQSVAPSSIAIDPKGNVFFAHGDLINGQPVGAVYQLAVANQYQTISQIGGSFNSPAGLAVDGAGNLFVADAGTNSIVELTVDSGFVTGHPALTQFRSVAALAVDGGGNLFVADRGAALVSELALAGGYTTEVPVGSGVVQPTALAFDRSDNLYIGDSGDGTVKEFLAAGKYATGSTLISGLVNPDALVIDLAGNIFVADGTQNAVKEYFAATHFATSAVVGNDYYEPRGLALDGAGNLYVADFFNNAVKRLSPADGYSAVTTIDSGQPSGVAVDAAGNIFVAGWQDNALEEIVAPAPVLVASVLPGARSVALPKPATLFATMVNSGTDPLDGCQIGLSNAAPTGLALSYQTTDPATNAPTGKPGVPVTLPGKGGVQSFLLTLTGSAPFSVSDLPLAFGCSSGTAAPSFAASTIGVDTLDLTLSSTPTADIIALSATPTGDGIVQIPAGGAAAFAVASSNVGANASITAAVDTGTASLPLTALICATDPATSKCLATPAASVAVNDYTGATPTFAIFLQATGTIALDPANARVFVRFTDAAGALHGATSVAVATH